MVCVNVNRDVSVLIYSDLDLTGPGGLCQCRDVSVYT